MRSSATKDQQSSLEMFTHLCTVSASHDCCSSVGADGGGLAPELVFLRL